MPRDLGEFRAMASPSHEPFLLSDPSLRPGRRVPSAWNGGSWLGCGDLPAMGAVFYLGAGWPQWKPLDIPGTHLPLKRGSGLTNKKGKSRLIINSESGGRGELASCPNSFVWDCSSLHELQVYHEGELFSLIIGLRCMQRASLSSSLHALQPYYEGE